MNEKKKIIGNIKINFGLYVVSFIVSFYITTVTYLTLCNDLKYMPLFPMFHIFVCVALIKMGSKFNNIASDSNKKREQGSCISFYLIIFFIIFAGCIFYWLAYYPGGFNLDAYGQWDQIHGFQKLSNWHPIVTTLFYWLITRVKDSLEFCIFTQIFIFSLSVSYLLFILFRLNVSKLLIYITAIYVGLNPAVGMNNACLYKDVPYTIVIIWMVIILLKVIQTDGKWLQSKVHMIAMVITLILVTLIRHNGIFYAIPVLLSVLFLCRNELKNVLIVVLMYSALIYLIQAYVFPYYEIEKHTNIVGEVVGVPMSIMANAFVEEPNNTPDDVKEFLLSVASEEEWKEHYFLGEWDSCKWEFGGADLFKGESVEKFLDLSLKTILAVPNRAYQSIRENTRLVWQVSGRMEWQTWVYIEENDYGIYETPNKACRDIVNVILDITATLVGTLVCWNIGVPNMIFVVLLWYVVACKEYKKAILIIPIIAYNILTMMLLCGANHRYFYFNSVLVLPILLFIVSFDSFSYKE